MPRTGAGSLSTDPEGIENDGCNGAGCDLGFNSAPFTVPVIANFTLIGTGDAATSGASGGIGMMLRRGTGGYYVNGVVARYPRGGVSLRDAETYHARRLDRRRRISRPPTSPSRTFCSPRTASIFQGANGTNIQNSLDMAGNALVASTTATTALFAALPAVTAATTASAFDWTPAANSPIATGGLATFTGKLATAAGTTVAGTAYLGAAQPGGTKWWQGWTAYARN